MDRFALSFGRVASVYDRVRPEWPAEAIDLAVGELGLGADAEVVDLAAGTGKLTRRLLERFTSVVAVEPDERMRAVLEQSCPNVVAGTAEQIPLPAESADTVFCGDAFHWFDGRAALAEIARVLRPRGALVLLWNDWFEIEPPLPDAARAALGDVYSRTGRAGAQAALEDWRAPFDGSPFEELSEKTITWQLELDADALSSLYLTPSGVASLPDDEREELRRALSGHLSGSYLLPVQTRVCWTRLR